MSKRLQVILEDAEYRSVQKLARKQKTTVSALVREAIRALRSRLPRHDAERKLAAIRQGARHSFPVGPIEQMLGEIERGYLGDHTS
ncbi:MAG: ribbon-helix-helix protein, CopG family [Gemmatimonadaceae bacterium]